MTIATTEVLEGQIVDREALLDSIAEYAQWLQEAERLVQAKSLEKAADLWALYSEGSWIEEWAEISPPAKDLFGKVDPGSKARFTQWLEQAEAARGNPTLSLSRVKQLLNAHEVMSALPAPSVARALATGVTEDAVQPLGWFKATGHIDRIPAAWRRAVELAKDDDEAERVTRKHVKQARDEFKSTLTPELQRQAINTPRAQTLRAKAQAAVEDLWNTGDKTEAKKFFDWFVEFVRAQQDAA